MRISKSQYIRGLQCERALWLYRHRRDLLPPPDARRQALFDTGHRVGELAKQLFPGGVEIEFGEGDFEAMIEQTERLVADGAKVIYEAAFRAQGVFIMADILVRNPDGWELYEVKASTSVKPYHEQDAAIQWFVLSRQIPLIGAHILHVDNGYVFRQQLDARQLLKSEDITARVVELQDGIDERLESFAAMLERGEPEIPIGPQCGNPFECDFKSRCWAEVPRPSVFDLYRLDGDRKFELFHRGLVQYRDLENQPLTAVQELQVRTALDGREHVDTRRLGEFIGEASYPINFLDFETFSSALPKFDGQRPYGQVPFQYSLHILHADGLIEHHEHLADGQSDPRRELAAQLLDDVTASGSIVAFNKGFEQSVIRALAGQFEPFAADLLRMNERFIDLITPFRELMYYHPDFNGSFSIKSILPAMFPQDEELDYAKLKIRDGEAAMNSYAGLEQAESADARETIRQSLLAYCRLDTLAMVAIWQKLSRLGE